MARPSRIIDQLDIADDGAIGAELIGPVARRQHGCCLQIKVVLQRRADEDWTSFEIVLRWYMGMATAHASDLVQIW